MNTARGAGGTGQPAAGAGTAKNIAAPNKVAEFSHAAGLIFGIGLKRDGFEVDADTVSAGLQEGLALTTNAGLMETTARKVVAQARAEATRKAAEAREKRGETNRQDGARFLAENAKKEDVHVLPSGLQYRILETGSGRIPTTNDAVMADYEARFLDGRLFESTYKRSSKANWYLDRNQLTLLPGLREALLLMPQGSKWQLFLPSVLADDRGIPDELDPGMTLIYELKLQSVTPIQEREAEGKAEMIRANRLLAAEFLTNNAGKAGVVTLPGGLQYQILQRGDGPLPSGADVIQLRYHGKTLDELEVMSTESLAEPFLCTLEQARKSMIGGISQALPRMPSGSKWRLFIPADLGFGDTGHPPLIQPGMALVVDVELAALNP
jgi:FKBP-type peptidyl-prolyl cis-trans isomerase FklB